MALSLEGIKALMRARAAAAELASAAKSKQSGGELRPILKSVSALRQEVASTLAGEDAELAASFDRSVADESDAWRGAEAHASALLGWLNGAIDSEQYEAQVRANAEAFVREKLKTERPVGFGA